MKILAIRGSNLASLSGEFEIDFTSEPLRSAGLFAITGPTGAGKSTLLDAMCLALFDSTPRLKDSSPLIRIGIAEEDDRLTSRDPRTMLQRGALHGFAEVDFVGIDSRFYRARWNARRKGKKATGKIDLTSELKEIGGEASKTCSSRTDTLKEIERLVGLSFEQFCRSVLLAQNDFAAFLKAEPNSRAALLEAMTGTEIYSRVSKLAFAVAGEKSRDLDNLRAKLPEQGISDEERQRLQQEEQQLLQREAALRESQMAAQKAVEWFATLDSHIAITAAAQQELDSAVRVCTEAAERSKFVDAVEAVQPLRPVFAAAKAAEAMLLESRGALAMRRKEEALAHAQSEIAAGEYEQALAECARVLKIEAELAPEIEKAAALDQKIENAEAETLAAASRADAAKNALNQANSESVTVAEQIRQIESGKAAATLWLAKNADREELVKHWGLNKKLLEDFHSAQLTRQELTGSLAIACRAAEDLRKTYRIAEAAEKTAAEALDRAEQHLHSAREDAARLPVEAAEADNAAVVARMRKLEALQRCWSEARAEREKEAVELNASSTHELAAAEEDRSCQAHSRQAEHCRSKLEGAKELLLRVQSECDVAEHRSLLQPGVECPLCGATEHPWAGKEPPANALLNAAKEGVAQIEKELVALTKIADQAETRSRSERENAEKCRQRAAAHKVEIEKKDAEWAQHLLGTPNNDLPASVMDPAAQIIKERLDGVLKDLKASEEQLSAARKSASELSDAMNEASERRIAFNNAAEQRREIEVKTSAAEQDIKHKESELKSNEDLISDVLRRLEPVFQQRSDWREALAQNPLDFMAKCENEIAEWRDYQAQLSSAETSLNDLRPKAEAACKIAEKCAKDLEHRLTEHESRSALEKSLRDERLKLLGGKATNQMKAELAQSVASARRAQTEKSALKAEAQTKLAVARAAREAAETHVTQTLGQQMQAAGELEKALAGLKLDEQMLQKLLAHDAEWIRAARKELRALENARIEAATKLVERTRAKTNHENSGRPANSREELGALIELYRTQINETRLQHEGVILRIKNDEADRQKREKLQQEIAAREKEFAPWLEIADLIGSNKGDSFRKFAQSLTLDDLVIRTNAHLQELHPRYGLERVPGEEMALQIRDFDMGDERRGVSSLSGGETFLVSLALALALSSLAANSTRVETLFIDEGFGSLDRDTLEHAIDLLDELQAKGRKVGIISHVPLLADRIGTKIRVVPLGGGRSRVITPEPVAAIPVQASADV
ncbi:MAG TPA: AAA family ATPase [Planctomycetota bacterium]|nr:AAA family ATPase [Planctomycetota bacterium]